ncbi:MAG TPA: hypothetical protein VGI74_15620 [Streptosporangiaceae bacterium]
MTPRDQAGAVVARLRDRGVGTAATFRTTVVPGGEVAEISARVWDGLRTRHESSIMFAGQLLDQVAAAIYRRRTPRWPAPA